YVEIPANVAPHSDRQLTVTGWFKTDGFSREWQNIFFKGTDPWNNGTNREYALWLNQNGSLGFSSAPAGAGLGQLWIGTPVGIIQPGRWHEFATVIDADKGRMQVFVDGQLQAE